jgi:DNA-directed RNA polymerase specialized sigma24 family protein
MPVLDLDTEQIDRSVDVEQILRLLGDTLANMERSLPELPSIQWPTLKPGTYLSDVLTVWNRASGDSAVDAALERLLTKPYTFRSGVQRYAFSRGCVFYPSRWTADQAWLDRYRREQGLQPGQLWSALGRVPLLVAIRELPRSMPIGLAYKSIRNRMRIEVERALSHGNTSDQNEAQRRLNERQWPEEDSPEALAMEAALAHDFADWLDLRLDLVWAMGLLTPNEREALLAHLAQTPDAVLAKQHGVGETAIRKRRSLARRKLSEFLAMR